MGGAIFNNVGATLTLTNSTLSGNSASGGGAGAGYGFAGFGGSYGGAIFNYAGILNLLNSTLSGNTTATAGGAIFNYAGTVNMSNTIIGRNPSDYAFDGYGAQTFGAGNTSNLIYSYSASVAAGVGANSILNVDPTLSPLSDNGGPTLTFLPLSGSPAIDAGSNAAAAGLVIDQRYYAPRIVNGTVDIGAVEVNATPAFPPTITSSNTTTFTENTAGTFTVTTTPGNPAAPITIMVAGVLPAGVTFIDNGNGTATLAGTPALGTAGSYALVITARNGILPDAVQNFTLIVHAAPPPASQAIYAVGADAGTVPQVNVYDANTGTLKASFLAYDASFSGGVRVAVADVNGDGIQDVITGAGPGGGPQVRVFDGRTFQPLAGTLGSFYGITPSSFTGGVFVAGGDVDADGCADVIVGADAGGGPQVQVWSGRTGALLTSFNALAPGFNGGVRVAAGDTDGDGRADIITGAGPGALPQVTVYRFSDLAILQSFYALPLSFAGGVYVAGGNVNGDAFADIVVGAGPGGGPQVAVFNGRTAAALGAFFAYDPRPTDVITQDAIARSGVRVAVTAVNQRPAILTAPGAGAPTQVKLFDAASFGELSNFFAFGPTFHDGAFVGG